MPCIMPHLPEYSGDKRAPARSLFPHFVERAFAQPIGNIKCKRLPLVLNLTFPRPLGDPQDRCDEAGG